MPFLATSEKKGKDWKKLRDLLEHGRKEDRETRQACVQFEVHRKDKKVGWHHQLDGHKFEQALGDGERQGSLACRSPWQGKESGTTEGLNNNEDGIFWKSPLELETERKCPF